MKKLKSKIAFTLVELVVIITIIAILAIWVSRINFNAISNKQALESFVGSISNQIETVRTNALVWKWVGTNLIVPTSWKMEFSKDNWTITTSYFSADSWIIDGEIKKTWYEIKDISCTQPDGTSTSNYNKWFIFFEKDKYSLNNWTNWCSWFDNKDYFSRIAIQISFNWASETLEFNTLNWLIKRIKN
jgi:Tfp pilus assembly protein FimT